MPLLILIGLRGGGKCDERSRVGARGHLADPCPGFGRNHEVIAERSRLAARTVNA